jgi:type III secretion system (T3SS) SseB-like protein
MSTSTPDDQPIQTNNETVEQAADPAAQAAAQELLRELAGSMALLPQSPPAEGEEPLGEDAIALPVVEQDGTLFVPVFTSEDRMRAAGADPETAVSVPLAGLAAGWPDEELWLAVDPAHQDGLALPPDAVRALPAFLEPAGQDTNG